MSSAVSKLISIRERWVEQQNGTYEKCSKERHKQFLEERSSQGKEETEEEEEEELELEKGEREEEEKEEGNEEVYIPVDYECELHEDQGNGIEEDEDNDGKATKESVSKGEGGSSKQPSPQMGAGWGVTMVRGRKGLADGTRIGHMSGPVELNEESKFFVGATQLTNNTAELNAIYEALIHIRDYVTPGETVTIRMDSLLASGVATASLIARTNIELARKVQDMYRQVVETRKIHFVHVKSHANQRWNEAADVEADNGREGGVRNAGRHMFRGRKIDAYNTGDNNPATLEQDTGKGDLEYYTDGSFLEDESKSKKVFLDEADDDHICPKCLQFCKGKGALTRHLAQYHLLRDKPLGCNRCGFTCHSAGILESHNRGPCNRRRPAPCGCGAEHETVEESTRHALLACPWQNKGRQTSNYGQYLRSQGRDKQFKLFPLVCASCEVYCHFFRAGMKAHHQVCPVRSYTRAAKGRESSKGIVMKLPAALGAAAEKAGRRKLTEQERITAVSLLVQTGMAEERASVITAVTRTFLHPAEDGTEDDEDWANQSEEEQQVGGQTKGSFKFIDLTCQILQQLGVTEGDIFKCCDIARYGRLIERLYPELNTTKKRKEKVFSALKPQTIQAKAASGGGSDRLFRKTRKNGELEVVNNAQLQNKASMVSHLDIDIEAELMEMKTLVSTVDLARAILQHYKEKSGSNDFVALDLTVYDPVVKLARPTGAKAKRAKDFLRRAISTLVETGELKKKKRHKIRGSTFSIVKLKKRKAERYGVQDLLDFGTFADARAPKQLLNDAKEQQAEVALPPEGSIVQIKTDEIWEVAVVRGESGKRKCVYFSGKCVQMVFPAPASRVHVLRRGSTVHRWKGPNQQERATGGRASLRKRERMTSIRESKVEDQADQADHRRLEGEKGTLNGIRNCLPPPDKLIRESKGVNRRSTRTRSKLEGESQGSFWGKSKPPHSKRKGKVSNRRNAAADKSSMSSGTGAKLRRHGQDERWLRRRRRGETKSKKAVGVGNTAANRTREVKAVTGTSSAVIQRIAAVGTNRSQSIDEKLPYKNITNIGPHAASVGDLEKKLLSITKRRPETVIGNKVFRISITAKLLRRLAGDFKATPKSESQMARCLDDHSIALGMHFLSLKYTDCIFANSWLYSKLTSTDTSGSPSSFKYCEVVKWFIRQDVFKARHIFIPLSIPGHWTLVVVTPTKKTIHYYDSMDDEHSRKVQPRLKIIKRWLKKEAWRIGKPEDTMEGWTLAYQSCPIQTRAGHPSVKGGLDCGVHALVNSHWIAEGKALNANAYRRETIVAYRRRLQQKTYIWSKTGTCEWSGKEPPRSCKFEKSGDVWADPEAYELRRKRYLQVKESNDGAGPTDPALYITDSSSAEDN